MKLSIVAPCFNEEGNIFALYERISASLTDIDYELVLVNDGSTDQTASKIEELLAVHPQRVVAVSHSINKGIPASWKSGAEASAGNIICLIDADLQNPPEAIGDLLRTLVESQADLVQGVRSSIGRLKDQRLVLSRGLNSMLNVLFRQNAKDSKSGFIVAPRNILLDVLTYRHGYRHFQTFIGVSARSKGYRVKEVETLFQSRNVGTSFLAGSKAYKIILEVFLDLLPALKEFGLRKNEFTLVNIRGQKSPNLPLFRRLRFELFFATMPLHKWIISRRARKLYLWLKGTEFTSPEVLAQIQSNRLRMLLMHAYRHVPYYKRVFDECGFKPNQFESLAQLTSLPLLEKLDVRSNIHFSMFSDQHLKREMHRINTSGSTGEPFVCYADKFQLEMRFATTLRALEMTGWRFGDKQLRLWHQTLGMSKSQVIREKIDALFMRRTFIPAFEMSLDSINGLVKRIERIKPSLIDGYAESLNFIASSTVNDISWTPKGVMSSAQDLTPQTRSKIEEIFKTKVYDKYGSREFSGIAYQCTEGKYHHVQDESFIVELLVNGRPAKPGEIGEIVITDLNNYSVPLIRYRIGDLAQAVEQRPCSCGRAHSQIGDITGRTQALVACANDVWLPGAFFGHFFKDYDFAIKQYQVFQEVFGEFVVKIVPTSQFSDLVQSQLVDSLHQYTGVETKIDIKLVKEIPLVRTGKRTPVISLVKKDFQQIDNKNILL